MKFLKLLGLSLIASACATRAPDPLGPAALEARHFPGQSACFLLYNMRAKRFEKIVGSDARCREELPACSTFKVPLAAMAFDAGLLKDEAQVLKWDGKSGSRDAEKRDQDALSWMRDSVVWFSQALTPKLGKERLQKYLDAFNYGNRDLRGGLTLAWLNQPDGEAPALRISAYGQAEFMRRLWAGELPISARAREMTEKITRIETSPKGYELHEKTGSNFFTDNPKRRLGWFVAHLQKGDDEYVAVTSFYDLDTPAQEGFGGLHARTVTKALLAELGLW